MPLTPTITSVRAAIKAQLQLAINGAIIDTPVHVHDYYRWFFDPKDLFDFFLRTDVDKVNGWEFDIEGIETTEDEERFRFFSVVQWKIYGYFGVKDIVGSSKELSDQIEAVISAFNLNAAVFGVPERPEKSPRCVERIERARMEKGQQNVWFGALTIRTEHIELKAA